MDKIQSYKVKEKISETRGSIFYRAYRKDAKESVVIQIIKAAAPTVGDVIRCKKEYHLIKQCNLPGVIEILEVLDHENSLAIVTEDIDWDDLKSILAQGLIFDIDTFLHLAIMLSETLGNLHQQNILHMGIKPANILIDPDRKNLKIVNFGITAEVSKENNEIYHPEVISDTLAYVSPEQTGRMNRQTDYRTDMYSLGVTFYEMLTGTLPFSTIDPMEMIHAHIAKNPVPVNERNPEIPVVISDIVLRLMAKTPEERYQNAFGLWADLKKCRSMYKEQNTVIPFELARHDIPDRFNIPQKIFGREYELSLIKSCFNQVCNGENRILLVSGDPGIGKTTLINEIHKPVLAKRAFFLSGKYQQFRKDVPYSSIIYAFGELVRQLLSESEAKISLWKAKILAAVGQNGGIIVNVIPDIKFIIGEQPAIPEIGFEESKLRFNIVFTKFVNVFTQPEHPLVLFLDDLQWADLASLELIEKLITSPDIHYLFLIGAYRDTEVFATHPFIATINDIKRKGIKVRDIILPPLAEKDVTLLVENFSRCTQKDGAHLGEIIHRKTGGNPFFVIHFLKNLYDQKLIQLDHESGWKWKIDHIKLMQVTDNVVELLAAKIDELSADVKELLKICACIGTYSPLQTLSKILNKSPEIILTDLSPAIGQGYLHFQNDAYWFHHDRIQEAAYSLIPEKKRACLHYQIGRLALENITSEKDLQDKLFYIVDQLNAAVSLMTDRKELDPMARLNLLAGNKAKKSGAYTTAEHYLYLAIDLLEKDCWQSDYEFTLMLHIEAAEAAYLATHDDKMEQLAKIILDNTKTLLEKVKVFEIKMQTLMARNNLVAAVGIGVKVLKYLGIKLPKNPGYLDFIMGLVKVEGLLFRKTHQDLLNIQPMQDPYALSQIRVLSNMATAAYYANPRLFTLLTFHMVTLTVRHGNTCYSPYNYAGYGLILCGINQIEKGYEYGQLAKKMIAKFDIRGESARTLFVIYGFIAHWKEHLKNCVDQMIAISQRGLDTGELEFAAHAEMLYCFLSLYLGRNLDRLEKEFNDHMQSMQKLKQDTSAQLTLIGYQFLLIISGKDPYQKSLTGTVYDKSKMIPLHLSTNNRTSLSSFYVLEMVLFYLWGEYERAVDCAQKAEAEIEALTASFIYALFFFYDSLSRLAFCRQLSKPKQKAQLKKVARNQRKMKRWARYAPMNFLHKWHLVEAERYLVSGQNQTAMGHFQSAILYARQNGYLHEEALANERFALFWFEYKHFEIAGFHMAMAHNGYQRWGAAAKVKQIESQYASLFAVFDSKVGKMLPKMDFSDSKGVQALDLMTVMKASQAISSDIVLGKLLTNVIKIMMENTGAQKGLIILERDGQLMVEAETVVGQEDVSILKSIPVDRHKNLAVSIVNYVARTREALIIDDASVSSEFKNDPYIVEHEPKSILCTAIINQGRLTAVIYLENALAVGVFTQERLEMVRLLSSQAAISIDNARLYTQVEGQNLDLLRINKQVSHLLEATKEMTKAKTKVVASITALVHLLALEEKMEIVLAQLFLPQQSGDSFHGYELCRNNHFIEQPVPYSVDDEAIESIKALEDIVIEKNRLVVPIKSQKLLLALLKIEYRALDAAQFKLARNFIEGITRSLALILENLETEDHRKLAGLGRMAASIAHDLKNSVGAIMGYAKLARDKSIDAQDLEQYLDIIANEAEYISKMAHEVLEFSRGDITINIHTIDARKYFDDLVKTLTPIFEEKSIGFEHNLHILGKIRLDTDKMRRVLINLATNSADAMAGTENKDARFFLNIEKQNGQIVFDVRDNGPGIPEHIQATIFEPFITYGKTHGTGLGMAIVKKIVMAHDGKISFETIPGRGTRFMVSIPVPIADSKGILPVKTEKRDKSSSISNEIKQKVHFLVAEDNPVNQKLILTLLGNLGYKADVVENGKKALEILEVKTYDLMFMDVQMPEMDGVEATRRIRGSLKNKINRTIPIIGMTAYSLKEDFEAFKQAGMTDFVPKPIDIDVMDTVIERQLMVRKV